MYGLNQVIKYPQTQGFTDGIHVIISSNKNDAAFVVGVDGVADQIEAFAIGQEVIVRTYSAGVWFGLLKQKAGNEVILKDARRLWRWWCKESISLSGVVRHGINQDKSRIAGAVGFVWLEAIEIMPITGEAADSIRSSKEGEQNE